MFDALTRLCQSKDAALPQELKTKALECLTSAMLSLDSWANPVIKEDIKDDGEDSVSVLRMSSLSMSSKVSPLRRPATLSSKLVAIAEEEGTSGGGGVEASTAPNIFGLEAADAAKHEVSEMQEFENKRQKKLEREVGLELFNKKPAKGIKFLQVIFRLFSFYFRIILCFIFHVIFCFIYLNYFCEFY